MKVELVNHTSDAVNLLLFTKNTRLMNDDDAYSSISDWPENKKQEELDYMLKTIRSSWEFIDYTFNILNALLIWRGLHITLLIGLMSQRMSMLS